MSLQVIDYHHMATMQMTTVQIRIDEKTKTSAKRVLDKLGLDMSGAIKMYLRQISLTKSLPLNFVTKNGLTIGQEMEILKAEKEALAGINVSKPMEGKAAIEYLRSRM